MAYMQEVNGSVYKQAPDNRIVIRHFKYCKRFRYGQGFAYSCGYSLIFLILVESICRYERFHTQYG